MSINQYSSDFHCHALMWQQQQQQHHHHNDVVEEKEALFEKPLTPSDVGKLNRLVIPKQHAERYFPLAAAAADAVEKGLLLCFEDEEGKPWRFRYSYWNSSQSYVLTKGWSRYVKEKNLDAGDVVLFHRHRADGGRFFIGWRRRGDSSSSSDSYRHLQTNASLQYYPHAGAQAVESQRGNSKTLRLFGVNMECQLDSNWSDPSGSTTCPTNHDQFHFYPQQQHYPSPYYMVMPNGLFETDEQETKRLKKHFNMLEYIVDGDFGYPPNCPCGSHMVMETTNQPTLGRRYWTCNAFKPDGFHYQKPWELAVEELAVEEELGILRRAIDNQAKEIAQLKEMMGNLVRRIG